MDNKSKLQETLIVDPAKSEGNIAADLPQILTYLTLRVSKYYTLTSYINHDIQRLLFPYESQFVAQDINPWGNSLLHTRHHCMPYFPGRFAY